MLLGFVFVVMGITIVQERRTERALDALRDLSSPRALVIRDGQQQAHRRPGGRPRRHHHPGRGRPRAGRRDPAVQRQPVGGRVAADRRIGARAQGGLPRTRSDLSRPGGDDLPSVFSGTHGHAGPGRRRGDRHGPADRDRQDRQGPADRSNRSRRCSRRRPAGWSATWPSSACRSARSSWCSTR